MDAEVQIKECKVCKKLLKRVFSGMFNKKDKKWKSPEGSCWNGHVCPDCHRQKCSDRQKKKREAK
jgi:hypothetical protein